MQTINIKSELPRESFQFLKNKRDKYPLHLSKDELFLLQSMIQMMNTNQELSEEEELERIILEELRQTLLKKYVLVQYKANLTLCRSHARTLFLWLSQYEFTHPLEKSLAYGVIDQIYKNLV
jgi:hypothetical protein